MKPERRGFLREILGALVQLDAGLETPPAEVPNYVNVRVLAQFGPARLAAVTRSTGRMEFHDASYPIAAQLGFADRLDYLPAGDKAAITPSDDDDVDAIVTVARAVLAHVKELADRSTASPAT